jgi:hypothetical protein
MAISAAGPDPGMVKALEGLLSAGGSSAGAEGRVYMGSQQKVKRKSGPADAYVRTTSDRWLSSDEAMAEFYRWDDKKRRDLLAQFIVGGLLPVGSGVIEAQEGWRKLVEAAGKFGAVGQKVTPFDLLSGYVKAAGGAGKDAWRQQGAFEVNMVTGERRYAGPGVYLGEGIAQQTDTRTDLTDPATARAIATKLFQDMMGRDPGAGELSAFATALHTAEEANPVTQTTTTQYNLETGQQVSQDTQSSGGMTAEARAHIGEQQIKGKKEYGVNQAVTTYQGALENLVFGSPG